MSNKSGTSSPIPPWEFVFMIQIHNQAPLVRPMSPLVRPMSTKSKPCATRPKRNQWIKPITRTRPKTTKAHKSSPIGPKRSPCSSLIQFLCLGSISLLGIIHLKISQGIFLSPKDIPKHPRIFYHGSKKHVEALNESFYFGKEQPMTSMDGSLSLSPLGSFHFGKE